MLSHVLSFLVQLQENNNREWFNSNKKDYETARETILSTVNAIIPSIAKFDETIKYVEAKDCMFRIYRDVRFSGDKSPYKTNMGAWITAAGRKSSGPGYYLHVQPGGSFLAAGVYMPQPDQLKKIRQEIFYNVEEFKLILAGIKAAKVGVGLDEMDKAKLAPRDFPKDFPDIDLLKHRHYTISHGLDDKLLTSVSMQDKIVKVFQALSPLNVFLRRALE